MLVSTKASAGITTVVQEERYELYSVTTAVQALNNIVCIILRRINGQLVALKVIRMKTEEGVPFTAIREGKTIKKKTLSTCMQLLELVPNTMRMRSTPRL